MISHAQGCAQPAPRTGLFLLPQLVWGTDSLEARMPSMNSCLVIFPSWSLSMRRKKSITRDFLWFIQRMYFFRQTSKSKFANSFSWKEMDSQHRNPKGSTGTPKDPQEPPTPHTSPGVTAGALPAQQDTQRRDTGRSLPTGSADYVHTDADTLLGQGLPAATSTLTPCPPPSPGQHSAVLSPSWDAALQHNKPLTLLTPNPPGTPLAAAAHSAATRWF